MKFSLVSLNWILLILSYLIESRRIAKYLEDESREEGNPFIELEALYDVDQDQKGNLRRQLYPKRNLITPFAELGIKDASDHKVTNLPGLKSPLDFSHYAGLIPLDGSKNHNIFYWLIESPTNAANKPLIIWLNGGPGCSSMDGLWLELGPFRLDERQSVRLNPFSWHTVANILFIDQPVGTGFSYTKLKNGYAKSDDMVNTQFYNFIINFFRLHNQYVIPNSNGNTYKTTRPIFFTGESHAGHFIPTIAQHILMRNEEIVASSVEEAIYVNIVGIALGNPWIDPPNQYNPAEYAHGLGLLTKGQVNKLKEQDQKCRKLISHGNYNSNTCIGLLDNVVDAASVTGHNKLLMYDVRKFLFNPNSFPPGHEAVETYLNKKEVKVALHVSDTPQRFQECTDPPYFALSHQDGKGVMNELRFLLEKGIEILIYNGQYDLICNHLNIEDALDAFNWTGQGEWLNARPGIWSLNKRTVGYVRKSRNLQTLLLLDSGHMVPMDIPEIALKMITTFIQKGSFKTGDSRLGVSSKELLENKEQIPRRLLRIEAESESLYHYFPILVGSSPLQSAVYLRLKLYSPASRHGHSVNKKFSYLLRVDPGGKVKTIEPTWFEKLDRHYYADIIVDELIPGIEYSFVLQYNGSSNGSVGHHHAFGSRRVVASKPGCYHEMHSQCCGHGDCDVDEESPVIPICRCSAGFSGEHCENYEVFIKQSNSSITHTGTGISCSTRTVVPKGALTLPLSSFLDADERSPSNHRPCSTNGTAKCCISVELLVNLSEWILQTSIRNIESMISGNVKNVINMLVGYKNLINAEAMIGSEPHFPKLLKGQSRSYHKTVPNVISHHGNVTISKQMPLVVSMCGSSGLLNKVYRDFEGQVQDPTAYLNQDISWRLNPNYYRIINQRSFSMQELLTLRKHASSSE